MDILHLQGPKGAKGDSGRMLAGVNGEPDRILVEGPPGKPGPPGRPGKKVNIILFVLNMRCHCGK